MHLMFTLSETSIGISDVNFPATIKLAVTIMLSLDEWSYKYI